MYSLILNEARSWIGTPYQHQASLKGVGCDCLGLVRGVWREIYGREDIVMPIYTPDWAESSHDESFYKAACGLMREVKIEKAKAGDLLLFRWKDKMPAKHCGILTSRTSFIHAHDGATVAEVAYSGWWMRRTAYAFRFKKRV